MRCPQCQHESSGNAKFCELCGSGLAQNCPACGHAISPRARFCESCGQPVQQTTSQRPAPEPRAYTPRHLAEKILTSRSTLEGERKQVTVLFADVKGSMELAEQVDPEEWHRIMDRFFAILSEGVHRFEGTINQYTGDGIMALFGAPIAHEDHARRACYTALHLQGELRRYADELRLNRGLNFSVRMGLNSGEVVVGKIGDDLRMDYTAQGHTVGLAARMEQIAAPDRVNLTQHTAQLVEGFFQVRNLGRSRVKGISEPVGIYELEGVGPMRTRLDVARSRGFSRFVGRADEMATLELALHRALEGNGQVVGVVGEAGVGKSRLCLEFVEQCRAQGLPVREGHGVAHGRMIPFLPVLELLRGYFEITEQDSARSARSKIAGVLLMLDRDLEPALSLMFDFLGVADPERPAPITPPDARQRQLFGVVRKLIRGGSERRPGVILIEDLHWVDGGTEAFLANAVEAVAGTRTLLLVNFRPEYRAAWMGKSYYQQVPLLPLGADAMRELLEDLLGCDPSLTGVVERIQEHTAGNPFFIEEVVQSLVETGNLTGSRGVYRLAHTVTALTIPSTVQAVLAARIDRLAEREKRLLQLASVIGKRFSEGILRQVVELTAAGSPEAHLADALGTLVAAEFMYEEALYPEVEYAFKHPLTQEVAYASQLSERRAGIHAAVARAIAARDPDKLNERAALLAHHWETAGETLEAARWHRRAAEWVGISHPAEGFVHWHKVRDLLASVPSSPETEEARAVAGAQIIFLGSRVAAGAEEMEALFREDAELARRSGDDAALARLSSSYGIFVCYTSGIVEDGLPYLFDAVELADRTRDLGLRVAARYHAALCCSFGGRIEPALTFTAQALDLGRDDPDAGAALMGWSPWAGNTTIQTNSLLAAGRIRDAEPLLDAVLEFARQATDSVAESTAHYQACYRYVIVGDPIAAVDHGRQGVEKAERTGSWPIRILVYHSLGGALVLDRQWDEAVPVLEHAIALLTEQRTFRFLEGMCLANLARAFLGRGEREQAQETARAAVRIGKGNGWIAECDGQVALAQVLTEVEGAAAAPAIGLALDRAAELVELSGAWSREPRIHEQRAALARLRGDDATYQRELREAHRLFTEMGATGHAERLAKGLKETKVPKRKLVARKPKGRGKTKGAKPGKKPKPVRQAARRKGKK